MMQLYDGGRVPNARRVRIFLAEKGMTVPMTPVDLAADEHKTDAFRALNARERVPVLVLDDGFVLTESIAICRYFEDLQPEPPLFGDGARGRAEVEMWQRRLEFELFWPVAHAFRHRTPVMASYEVPQVAAWGDANAAKVPVALERIDLELGDKPFITGDAISVADITALVALDFTRAAKIAIPEGLANVRRWHAALSARPSAKA